MGGKILLVIFCFVFIGNVGVTFASDTERNSKTDWELISEANGIKLLERWITNDNKLKVKERTGRMTLNCSVEDVLNLIHDSKRTQLWMESAEQVEIIKVVNDNTWYVHTILDTPWPFSKQDMVSKYSVIRDIDSKNVRVLIEKNNALLPPIQDIDRLDSFNAEWIIEYVKENKVKVTFTTISTKPPEYPSWAQDPVVRKVFTTNLKNFKSLLNNKG